MTQRSRHFAEEQGSTSSGPAFFLVLAAVSWWFAQGMKGNRRIAVEYFLVVFVSIGVAVLAIGLVFAVLSYRSSRKERS